MFTTCLAGQAPQPREPGCIAEYVNSEPYWLSAGNFCDPVRTAENLKLPWPVLDSLTGPSAACTWALQQPWPQGARKDGLRLGGVLNSALWLELRAPELVTLGEQTNNEGPIAQQAGCCGLVPGVMSLVLD